MKGLYRELFEQRELLASDRESLELCWGFGRLRWPLEGPNQPIDYPSLTIPVEVDLDAATNELRVRPGGAVEIESLHLSDVSLDDPTGSKAVREAWAADEGDINPWDADELAKVVRQLVRAFDHDGVVDGESPPEAGAAVVDASWMLFMRRRRPDYQGFLDGMRELYGTGAAIPDPLQALVIDAPSTLVPRDDGSEDGSARPDREPLLLPLPTNDDQQRILTLAQSRPGVTVQGPPGTGKSHMVAHIISHHLAYGRRVLVVAEKEQALRVLAEKIPPGIRDLTVSILGADDEGRRRLESSIGQIQTRVTSIDKRFAEQEIARLAGELESIDRSTAQATDRLFRLGLREASHFEGDWAVGKDPDLDITPGR